MQINRAELEAKIRRRVELSETGRLLEWALHNDHQNDARGEYLYLYGLALFKGKNFQKSIEVMEEASKIGCLDVRAIFLLAKLYMKNSDPSKAMEAFKKCLLESYREKYCRRALIKLSYQASDYVAVNNYAIEFHEVVNECGLLQVFRIEALAKMQLYQEAYQIYHELKRLRGSWERRLEKLLVQNQTIYEARYELNREFFYLHNLFLEPYARLKYKISNYRGQQLVYDCETQGFVASITQEKNELVDLNLAEGDTLLIYNSEDLEVFEYLERVLENDQSKIYQQRMTALPVFIFEKDQQNWQLLMQLFDFRVLHKWSNLHFIIGSTAEDLGAILLDAQAPLPNILYGTDLPEAKQLLMEIGNAKEEFFKQNFEEVSIYYQYYHQNQMQKIMVITSIYSDFLYHYAKRLQQYLQTIGYTCQLERETAPYYKFTRNRQIKLVKEFCPDLIIHFLGTKDELELFKRLKLPFVSWLLFAKQLNQAVTSKQKIYYTGIVIDEEEGSDCSLPLPVPELIQLPNEPPLVTGEIGITVDLGNLNTISKSIINQLIQYQVFNPKPPEIIFQILQMLYLELEQYFLNIDLIRPEEEVYLELIEKQFVKCQVQVSCQGSSMMAGIIKHELEHYLFKRLQVRWLIEQGYRVQLYGAGWGEEVIWRDYYCGEVDFLENLAEYRRVISGNSLHLYLGNRVQNNSLLQPDLINGIALGGFYLVSPLLIDDSGDTALAQFDNQLESYRSKHELLTKIAYYLAYPEVRETKAKTLQAYVLKHFRMEKIAKKLILGARDLSEDKIN